MKRLRNVFDQYSQEENHITNSFLLVLHHNRDLLDAFLKKYRIHLTKSEINLLSQVAPRKVGERESIPDGYIYTNDYKCCIGIETKITKNALHKKQILGHIKQLEQYENFKLIILTPDEAEPKVIKTVKRKEVIFISWFDLLSFISKFRPSKKNAIGQYLYHEFIKYMEKKYNMTPFLGFKFEDGYDKQVATHYAKRISSLVTPYIRKLYPICKNTRPQMSSGLGYPWEAWYSTPQAQNGVHPGISIRPEIMRCDIVLANGCGKEWKMLSKNLQDPAALKRFKKIIKDIYKKRPKGSETYISFRQRHYLGMRNAIQDAETKINLAAFLGIDGSKKNDIWLKLLEDIANSKNKYNYQLEIGYSLKYGDMPNIKTGKAIDIIKQSFLQLKPIYSFLTTK